MDVIIDAKDSIVGRLSTYVAKQALIGNKVIVLNCELAIITGNKKVLERIYLNKKNRGGTSQKGPYFSKRTDMIVKKAIRGMLPWKKTTGREAYKRIRCYSRIPIEFEGKKFIEMKKIIKTPHLKVKEIAKLM